MPKIKAFKGIRPAKDKVLDVIVRPFDNFGTEQAKEILENNPHSFLHVIEPSLDSKFLRASKEEIVHFKARENFDELVHKKILIQDKKPSIYIYRVRINGSSQTGIWTCSSIDDYLNNTIKKHELTRADRERALISYLENTSVDANPVLITYFPNEVVNRIIEAKVKEEPEYNFVTDGNSTHQLWIVDDDAQIAELIHAFAEMPSTYIADGHHRAASASLLGMQKRMTNLKHKGTEDYNFFTSLYFSTDQIIVYAFHRLIKDLNGLSVDDFIDRVAENFLISESIEISKPDRAHHFGMYLEGKWYSLIAKPFTYSNASPVEGLDVSIIHDQLLNPVLGIKDARTDKRIDFIGGIKDIKELIGLVDSGKMKVAFTLYPTSIEELIAVADNGDVMPPKSTWFEPKLHCGLLVHQL